jgi:GTPase SAR1 family protein
VRSTVLTPRCSLFDHLERINAEHYVPTVEDYLRVRIRTTGAEEAVFDYEGVAFRVADVGGQRIERRKWKQAVDNATAFIFCAAMSEYDQTLREDETQNRMKETLLMFEEIVTGELTARIPVILLLNKTDLFRAKIAHTPITIFWPNYSGATSFEATSSFVRKQFVDLGPPCAEIYTHFTCAIDTENIRLVWKDVRETIYKKLLKGAGAGFLM